MKRNQSESRCLAIAERGLNSSGQFAAFMSAMMADVVSGRIAPNKCEAAVHAGAQLLKCVTMAHKYGAVGRNGMRTLKLTAGTEPTVK